MLILALDANFRLKNRFRADERPDPELGPGWAYFVENGPYLEHLKNYVSERDVSIHFVVVYLFSPSIILADKHVHRFRRVASKRHACHNRSA